MRKRIFYYLLAFLLLTTNKVCATDTYEGSVVTPKGAWCWFADPRALHYENPSGTINSTYIGYIDVHGNIKAMQYDFLTGKRNEVLIRSYFQPDDHNNPTFLVLPDERVMIFYSRHTDEACFYYRISRKKGDITTLGEEKKILTKNNTTYPSPFILSDDPDHIYLCWRGINWHPTIAQLSIPTDEDEVDVTWGPYQMVQSSGSRPYAKYQSNGKDKILLAYTTGHPDNEQPNFLYFNYIDIKTLQLQDVKGNALSTIANGPFAVNKNSNYVNNYASTVVDNPTAHRDWLWQVVVAEDGNPAIAMVRIDGGKTSHDYYYAKWTGNEWKKIFLANGGGHFHQTPNLEMCYSGGMAIDPENTNVVYCSAPVNGTNGKKYEILKFIVKDDGVVEKEAITKNSTLGNARPYMIPGSGNSPLRLTWMHGNYYDWIVSSARPNGYPTAINCDYAWPAIEADLEKECSIAEYFDGTVEGTAQVKSGVLVSTTDTYATFAKPVTGDFSISLSSYLSVDNYGGKIVKMGNLSYEVDYTTMKPILSVGDRKYISTNILATSDVWKTKDRGTGGQWYTPSKHAFFNLTITYENGILRTYINGMIDQSVEIDGLTYGDVFLGGFDGWIEDCLIYTRALHQEEIEQLTTKSLTYKLSDDLLAESDLSKLFVPAEIYTDIVLPATSSSGSTIVWASSNTSVLATSGLITQPATPVAVTLTAKIGTYQRVFDATVMPREIERNKQLHYTFEAEDVYEEDGELYLTDHSAKGRHARIKGSARVNGWLDLTANTAAGFSTNGYLLVPQGVLKELRSYSFFMRVQPTHLNKAPRLYDFGSASGNSVFGRGNTLTGGVKYNGGTTAMVNSSKALLLGKETFVAFTFDAKTKVTKVYVNGEQTGSGTNITYAPYQLAEIGMDARNYIGRTQWWDSSVAADNIDYCGLLDDFYVFDIALTRDELVQLQQAVTSIESVARDGANISLSTNICRASETIQVSFKDVTVSGKCLLEILTTQGGVYQTKVLEDKNFSFQAPREPGCYIVCLKQNGIAQVVQKIVVL